MSQNDSRRSLPRWLRFRLSAVFLLVFLCAMTAFWQRDRGELVRLQTQLEETRRNQQEFSASLERIESELILLRPAAYRDERGILRRFDGQPVGIWGVDSD